jgi:probable F420-dependent oxidoreductase
VKFVFNYPETSGLESDLLDSGEISDVAVAVEAAGFDAFALTEHPIPGANWLAHGGHQTLDPFVGLAFAAAVTERIKLLTHLSVVPYRNPFLLAKTAATLDRCSQGRFILGLGAGYHKTEFFALGVDFDERNALFDEALEALPKAWSGEPFDAEGLHFTAKGVIQRPRPAQDPIPIWIGGNSKLSRRRAATVQGWMPMGIPEEVARTTRSPHISGLEQLAEMIAEVKDLAGDRAGELDFCMSYMEEGIHQPTSDIQRHVDELGRMEAAGVNWVNVGHPPTTPQQMLDFIEAFGETYTSR